MLSSQWVSPLECSWTWSIPRPWVPLYSVWFSSHLIKCFVKQCLFCASWPATQWCRVFWRCGMCGLIGNMWCTEGSWWCRCMQWCHLFSLHWRVHSMVRGIRSILWMFSFLGLSLVVIQWVVSIWDLKLDTLCFWLMFLRVNLKISYWLDCMTDSYNY